MELKTSKHWGGYSDIVDAYHDYKHNKYTKPIQTELTEQAKEYNKKIRNTDIREPLLASYGEARAYIYQRYRSLTEGKPFEQDRAAWYSMLAQYASKDSDFVNNQIVENKASLDKGIALFGGFGSGKSTLIKCLCRVPKEQGFYLHGQYTHYINANEFAVGYNKNGAEHFDEWKGKKVLVIDDVGNEPNVKYFGSDTKIIGQLLLYRYERRLLTHITSNKNPSELKELYGGHIADRFFEMLNLCVMDRVYSLRR